jgi:hypothetical protein
MAFRTVLGQFHLIRRLLGKDTISGTRQLANREYCLRVELFLIFDIRHNLYRFKCLKMKIAEGQEERERKEGKGKEGK